MFFILRTSESMAKDTSTLMVNTCWDMQKHKLAHRTTWTSVERINQHQNIDGTVRRNPYRNQIDYIITKFLHKGLVQDSRSYSGISTSTDHKLVKAKMKLEWWRLKKQCKKVIRIDVDRLRDPEVKTKYREQLNTRLLENRKEDEHPNASWKRISETCKEAVKDVIGLKEPNKGHSSSVIVRELSAKQKKLRADAESSKDKRHRIELKRERNNTLKQLKKELKSENDKMLDLKLQDIERYKDDSNKCHQAIRKIKSHKPQKPLSIFDNNHERVTTEDDQLTIITEYFTKLFASDDKPEDVTPEKM